MDVSPKSKPLMSQDDEYFLAVAFAENECKRALLNCFDVVASLAQWQSTGLVNQGSRIQIPHAAVLFGLHVWLITFDANKRNLFSCGTSLQLTVMQFRLQLERFVHGI